MQSTEDEIIPIASEPFLIRVAKSSRYCLLAKRERLKFSSYVGKDDLHDPSHSAGL